eukprot:197164_1
MKQQMFFVFILIINYCFGIISNTCNGNDCNRCNECNSLSYCCQSNGFYGQTIPFVKGNECEIRCGWEQKISELTQEQRDLINLIGITVDDFIKDVCYHC